MLLDSQGGLVRTLAECDDGACATPPASSDSIGSSFASCFLRLLNAALSAGSGDPQQQQSDPLYVGMEPLLRAICIMS